MGLGGGLEDALAHLRMGHRPRAVHTGHLTNRGSGDVGGVHTALARRGPHQSMLNMFHGLEDLQCMPGMSSLLD